MRQADELIRNLKEKQERTCSSNVYNCDAFKDWREAKKVFDTCGGVNNDVHHLDGDKDGIPCETLS